MSGSWTIDASVLLSFLACLAHVAGTIAFVPLPGFRNSPPIARIVLAMAICMCLRPVWPPTPALAAGSPIGVAGWAMAHAAAGLGAGVAVAMLLDGFLIAAQALGLQAGYSYASTIDPTTQSDSGILQILAQLLAGLLFFALGLDRVFVKALAAGMAAGFAPPVTAIDGVMRLGSSMFATGVRLAFPVIAALLLVDIAAAIAGRVQAQLQLLSVAFPAKMLAGMAILAMTLAAFPPVFEKSAGLMFRILPSLGN